MEHRRGRHRHRQRRDGIRNNGKNLNSGKKENKKNDKINNGGRSGKYSRSEPLHLLQESCTFKVFFVRKKNLQTLAKVVHTTVGENRIPHGTQHTRMFFSLRAVYHICFTFHVSSIALALAQDLSHQVSVCVVCSKQCACSAVIPSSHVLSQPSWPAWEWFYYSWQTGEGIWDPLYRSRGRWLVWPNGCTVSAHKRDIQRVQRSLTAYNQRTGNYRTVRVGRDFQNCSMHNVPEILKRRNILLQMWCMSCAVTRTDRGPRHGPKQWQYDFWKAKDAKSGLRGGEYTSLLCTDGLLTHNIENPNRTCRRILLIPGLSVRCWCELHCNMARKSKVSQHGSSWSSKTGRIQGKCRNETFFLFCSLITCCSRTQGRKGKP